MATYGNTSPSNLVKSANSVRSSIAAYNDQIAQNDWDNSAKTDADFQTYYQYLNNKRDELSKLPQTIQNVSRLQSIDQSITTANRSYTSETISRVTSSIIEGSANSVDKLGLIGSMYSRAKSIGDENLAQNLYQQYESYSQTVQKEAITAQTASDTLANANAAAQEKGYQNVIDALDSSLQELTRVYKTSGQTHLTASENQGAKTIIDTIQAMNANLPADQQIVIPEGASINNGILIQAVLQAKGQIYGTMSDIAAASPGGASDAQSYSQKAIDYFQGTGSGKVSAFGRDWYAQDASNYAKDVGSYYEKTNLNGGAAPTYSQAATAIVGYTADGMPIHAGEGNSTPQNIVASDLIGGTTGENKDKVAQIQKELEKLGFSDVNIDTGTGEISANMSNNDSNKFISSAIMAAGVPGSRKVVLFRTDSGYKIVAGGLEPNKALGINTVNPGLMFDLTRDTSGNFALGQAQKILSAQQAFNVGADAINPDLQKYGWQGAVQKTANNYYGGNTESAARAVNATIATPAATLPVQQAIAIKTPVANATPASLSSGLNSFAIGGNNSINTAMQKEFANYTSKPKGYTETTILKNIANQFFGGDIKAAAKPVYDYRKTTFGE